jgi:general secretion pathway protein D
MTMTFSRLTLALIAAGMLAAPLPLLAAQPSGSAQQQQQDGWTINLKDADIREFIDQIADITGETFIVDPRVKGQVSVVSKAPLGLNEVYQLFLSVMATHGFTVVTQGEQARILPNAEAKAEASSTRGGAERLETRVIQVQHSPVTELIPLIRPLVPQYGHLAAVPTANALIISDRAANIARIEDLMRQLDQKGDRDYTVLNLKHAWVMDAAEVLNAALNRGQSKGGSGTQVIADARTNRLILLGPPSARAKLAALAQSLDTPTSRSANTRVIRLRHNDAKSLAETLGEISEGLKNGEGGETATGGKPQNILIRADESLNALVMLAEPDVVNAMEDIVRQLDVPRAQVMVEAAIVEISGDITEALGVQWAVDARGNTGGAGGVNFGNTGLSIGTVLNAIRDDEIPESLPDGAIIGIGTDSFGALITALSANSRSNLLSTPSLLTLDNQKAEILVGQNVPFQTGSYTTDSAGASNPFTTVERKDIGITLKVTPHINDGRTLRLKVEQESSELASAPAGISTSDVITNKRSVKSTILADDGQIIVIGGLIKDNVKTQVSKVPLLGDIPLLGRLFRSSKDVTEKTNLMVFLRPTLLRSSASATDLGQRRYDHLRRLGNGQRGASGLRLPDDPHQLFDADDGPVLDMRGEPGA